MSHGLEKIMQLDPTYVVTIEDTHGSVKDCLAAIKAMNNRKPRGKGKNKTSKRAASNVKKTRPILLPKKAMARRHKGYRTQLSFSISSHHIF